MLKKITSFILRKVKHEIANNVSTCSANSPTDLHCNSSQVKELKELSRIEYESLSNFEDNYEEKSSELMEKYEDLCYEIFDIWDINKRKIACKKAIEAFEKVKLFCYEKGFGGKYSFDEWNNYLSQSNELNNINNLILDLDELNNEPSIKSEKIKKDLFQKYGRDVVTEEKLALENEKRIKKATSDLLKLIKNNPGILQKGIYEHFPKDLTEYIKKQCVSLEKETKIIRNKNGNTYELYIYEK